MTGAVIGWDIGGAHVKAVWLDSDGVVQSAVQLPCALWKGLDLLSAALRAVMATFDCDASRIRHVVTMTGELVDLFQSRQQGVEAIANCVRGQFPDARFYAADGQGPRLLCDVAGQETAVASMNWHASALSVAQGLPDVLVVDIGSTTTDVTACVKGRVMATGWTDAARMAQGSLLYSGVVRTPLMALGPRVSWQGRMHWLAAEYFATTADVYRLLGVLPAAHDMADTADGQDKSQLATMRRLARMVGHDIEDLPGSAWLDLARAFAAQQQEWMLAVCKQQLANQPQIQQMAGLGAGAFLLPALSERLGLRYQPAAALIRAVSPDMQAMAAVSFPAYAVASLGQTWR